MDGEEIGCRSGSTWTTERLSKENVIKQCKSDNVIKKRFHFHIKSKYLFNSDLFSSFHQRSLGMTQLFKNQSHFSSHVISL